MGSGHEPEGAEQDLLHRLALFEKAVATLGLDEASPSSAGHGENFLEDLNVIQNTITMLQNKVSSLDREKSYLTEKLDVSERQRV